MRGLIAAVCLAALGVAGEARATEWKKDLHPKWEPAANPRKGETARVARVPNASAVWVDYADGSHHLRIVYDDGTFCSTGSGPQDRDAPLSVTCGTQGNYYMLTFVRTLEPSLTWHTDAPERGIGEK